MKTQCEHILEHMRAKGYITLRDAFIDYGVQSFTRRITDLEEAGYTIRREAHVHPTTGQPYTRYYLDAEAA